MRSSLSLLPAISFNSSQRKSLPSLCFSLAQGYLLGGLGTPIFFKFPPLALLAISLLTAVIGAGLIYLGLYLLEGVEDD